MRTERARTSRLKTTQRVGTFVHLEGHADRDHQQRRGEYREENEPREKPTPH